MVPQIGTEGFAYAAGTEETVGTENFGTTDADPVDMEEPTEADSEEEATEAEGGTPEAEPEKEPGEEQVEAEASLEPEEQQETEESAEAEEEEAEALQESEEDPAQQEPAEEPEAAAEPEEATAEEGSEQQELEQEPEEAAEEENPEAAAEAIAEPEAAVEEAAAEEEDPEEAAEATTEPEKAPGKDPKADAKADTKEAEMHTVSFDDGGGTGSMEAVQVAHGEKYTLPACAFTAPEGEVFFDWYWVEGEEDLKPGAEIIVDADVTLSAVWVEAFHICIGGIWVTPENCEDVLGDGTVSYDPWSRIMSLNQADFTAVPIQLPGWDGNYTYNYALYSKESIYVELTGTNVIRTEEIEGVMLSSGIFVEGEQFSLYGGPGSSLTIQARGYRDVTAITASDIDVTDTKLIVDVEGDNEVEALWGTCDGIRGNDITFRGVESEIRMNYTLKQPGHGQYYVPQIIGISAGGSVFLSDTNMKLRVVNATPTSDNLIGGHFYGITTSEGGVTVTSYATVDIEVVNAGDYLPSVIVGIYNYSEHGTEVNTGGELKIRTDPAMSWSYGIRGSLRNRLDGKVSIRAGQEGALGLSCAVGDSGTNALDRTVQLSADSKSEFSATFAAVVADVILDDSLKERVLISEDPEGSNAEYWDGSENFHSNDRIRFIRVPGESWTYPLTIGGIHVTDENCQDVFGDGTVSFDPKTYTLSLNNAEIPVAAYGEEMAGIGSGCSMLTIRLHGENRICGNREDLQNGFVNGITENAGDLILEGDGSLRIELTDADSTNNGDYNCWLSGIYALGKLYIGGCPVTVDLTATREDLAYPAELTGVYVGATLFLQNADIDVQANGLTTVTGIQAKLALLSASKLNVEVDGNGATGIRTPESMLNNGFAASDGSEISIQVNGTGQGASGISGYCLAMGDTSTLTVNTVMHGEDAGSGEEDPRCVGATFTVLDLSGEAECQVTVRSDSGEGCAAYVLTDELPDTYGMTFGQSGLLGENRGVGTDDESPVTFLPDHPAIALYDRGMWLDKGTIRISDDAKAEFSGDQAAVFPIEWRLLHFDLSGRNQASARVGLDPEGWTDCWSWD
ncbi:MAG: InlB B-repeat-containing protein, partial [Firmicutes bacterium]|nr:InlB B-repeat-containing protein [Bacillota bacterium]